MSFNFGSFAQVKPANNTSYLKPYTINGNVTIKGTEILEGTSANGTPWKRLEITFGNEEGIYKDSTFYLDIEDPQVNKRGSVDMPNGGKRELPSQWEKTYNKLAAIGHAFAPELIQKFNSVVGKCKTFDDFIIAYKSMLDKVIDKNPTNMKLVGRTNNGTVYAALPNCVGIACASTETKARANQVEVGEWYTWMTSPFSNNPTTIAFSKWEKEQADEYNKAKPTPVGDASVETDTVNNFDSASTGSEDIDFSSLL